MPEENEDLLDELLSEDTEVWSQEDKKLKPLLDEINLIVDQSVRLFVRSMLLKAEDFWTDPSSFSGKHHPPDERAEGGNVLHTKRVVRLVKMMCESQSRAAWEIDITIAAALLHDLNKGKDGHYDPLHPYTVDWSVQKAIEVDDKLAGKDQSTTLLLEEEFVAHILRLVRCHLGPWSPIPETVPLTTLEVTLHLADMIAANLHNIIDGENVDERRWLPAG